MLTFTSEMNSKLDTIELHLRSRGRGKDLSAIGTSSLLVVNQNDSALVSIQEFIDAHPGEFIFFVFSYELKDSIESLNSANPSFIPTPLAVLFTSEVVLERQQGRWTLVKGKDSTFNLSRLEEFESPLPSEELERPFAQDQSSGRLDRSDYVNKVDRIKEHIQKGDIYEMNFCTESRFENIEIDPSKTFNRLLSLTNAPYSAYLRFEGLHLLCASPESYLEKKGLQLISRPIKGTRKRDPDPSQDMALKEDLQQDLKERAENIMITDLVRNDLSRVAEKNSVRVKELCEVYTYDTVHQMISTVECRIPETLPLSEVFRATFPMGSMTGAPKVRAMELIESLEDFRRGWFSGCIGYVDPKGDMTSNVIIRSIVYDETHGRASISAGGAITSLSAPEKEYEERMLKVEAITRALFSSAQKRSHQE